MIYHMTTKTLVKEFTKDHSPDEILDCDFISFSTRVQGCNVQLHYGQKIFFGLEAVDANAVNKDKLIASNIELCKKSLVDTTTNLKHCLNIVANAIADPKKTFVILYSPKEAKTLMPAYYMKAIEELLGYPIIDYKEDKHKDFTYKPKRCLKVIDYYIAKINLDTMSLDDFKKLPEKEKKRLLKMVKLYSKDMDEDMMDDTFEDKFWDLPFM